ncbi:MAG: tetratricopeptide repeat-containing sensor histidine kinase [Melioribacteraceae bacterium]|nr:MAG: tetratricopeptide repeat-containing sensor histidine kinase [Melioribacteraceae bacterium]
MKVYILVLLILSTVFAQPNLDSLLSEMKGSDDTTIVRELNDLTWELRSSNPSAAKEYGLAALKIVDRISNQKYKSQLLNFLGVIYGNLGDLDSAYHYYKLGYELGKENNNKREIAYSLNNLGDYYFKKALYSVALENIMESYNIFEEINDQRGMAYTLNDIGEIYMKQFDHEKALEYFKRSGDIRLAIGDDRGYAKSLINMASVYENQNRYELALSTYFKAYDVSLKSNYLKGESYVLAGISDLYYKQGNLTKSLESRLRALEIDLKIENKYGELICYNNLGLLHMNLGDLNKAEEFLKKAKEESQKTGHLDQLMVSYQFMTELAVKKNDFETAYNSLNEYQLLKEKIYGQENLNKIADLQTAFATERKDRENERLKLDIQYQKTTRNYLILITILILIGVGLFVLRYRAEKKANNLLKELNSSKDKFFSIFAHDLKNPFNALLNIANFLKDYYDDFSDKERKEMITSIYDASKDIHKQLEELLTWARSQKGELGINKVKLNLHELLTSLSSTYRLASKNKNIALKIDSDEMTEFIGDKFVIETVIGNFVDNAIKFSPNGSEVIVSGQRKNNTIEISVKDSGVGIDEKVRENLFKVDFKYSSPGTNNEKGTGLGLKICKEFAELHGGTIEVKSEVGNGSTFILKIPV